MSTGKQIATATRSLASAKRAIDIKQKYTVGSTGIWERIRRALAVDPDRSSGIPLNPQYRNPPPGAANPASHYDDPVTLPAGDLAENPYWQRDVRRAYPRASTVTQADAVALLTVGSRARPKEEILRVVGDAGSRQLVAVRREGREVGLAALLERDGGKMVVVAGVLGEGGLPPMPSGMSRASEGGGKRYVMDRDREEGFPEEYPCRTFV